MADLSLPQTEGGQYTGTVAASSTGDVVVSAVPGRICKVSITTAGSAALELYDHASASSGADLVFKSAANTAVGEVLTVNVPVANGIVGKRATNTPAYTVSYMKDEVSGTAVDKVKPVTTDGQYASTRAAGASGAGVVLAEPGRLCSVVVLAQGSAATPIYDNASAASGTVLFTIPASGTTAVAAGTRFNIEMPCANGIYFAGTTNTSQAVVTYNKAGALGK